MPSLQSRIINFLIRNRHWFRFRLRKEKFDGNTSIQGFREQCEKGAGCYAKVPKGVSIREERIEDMQANWIVPPGTDPSRLILYVHGGGYVAGSCSDHRGFVAKLAANCGVTNLLYEYRLAPEHPFPAALDDSVILYQALLARGFLPENLILVGESAGGGLVLSILLALKERGISMPSAAVAISPWADLTCSSASYTSKNKCSVAPLDSWTVFSRYYSGRHDPRNPLISPVFGDPSGLPPLLIQAGTDDELFEDGEQFARKAKAAGVDVTFRAGEGMIHCYPLLAPMFPEAVQAMGEICRFIRRHLRL